jgi:hypothetical protein
MNVRRAEIGVVQGTDAYEPAGGTGLRVVAPNRDPASRAAGYLLALAARRGRPDEFGLVGGVYDTIGFIESVERMRGPGLALAPTAMTSMNNQGRSDQTISDLPACASALHIWFHQTDCIDRWGHTQLQSSTKTDKLCGNCRSRISATGFVSYKAARLFRHLQH